MLAGEIALIIAAIFTGAAVYINIAEHPARLQLDDRALLTQWKPSYKRGFAMQATLAVTGCLFGIAAWYLSGDWRWLIGALVLFSNWPFTLIAIMPLNNRLQARPIESADAEMRAELHRWGHLHAIRGALGALATMLFLWAMH